MWCWRRLFWQSLGGQIFSCGATREAPGIEFLMKFSGNAKDAGPPCSTLPLGSKVLIGCKKSQELTASCLNMVGVKIARNEDQGGVCWVETNRRDEVCNADSCLRDEIVKGLNKSRKKFRPAERASAAKWKIDGRRTPLEERWPAESFSCHVTN